MQSGSSIIPATMCLTDFQVTVPTDQSTTDLRPWPWPCMAFGLGPRGWAHGLGALVFSPAFGHELPMCSKHTRAHLRTYRRSRLRLLRLAAGPGFSFRWIWLTRIQRTNSQAFASPAWLDARPWPLGSSWAPGLPGLWACGPLGLGPWGWALVPASLAT